MSLLRRILGVMPKRQISAVFIAGLLLVVTAGAVLGANAAATGVSNPDIISLVEQDMANGTMNASEFQSSEVPTSQTSEAVLENPTLNRLLTPLVKLAMYPAQAGSLVGYWSVGAIGQGATMFWLYGTVGLSLGVPVGHAARRVMLDD
jgi:hypothetical protein